MSFNMLTTAPKKVQTQILSNTRPVRTPVVSDISDDFRKMFDRGYAGKQEIKDFPGYFVPGLGQMMAFNEMRGAEKRGDWGAWGLSALGLIPGAGMIGAGVNAAKQGTKAVSSALKTPTAAANVSNKAREAALRARALDRSRLTVRMPSTSLLSMARNGDTQYRTIRDTGVGRGSNDLATRTNVENQLFGEGANPTYGYLRDDTVRGVLRNYLDDAFRPNSAGRDSLIRPSISDRNTSNYGDIALYPKKSVAARSTVTPDDSFKIYENWAGTALNPTVGDEYVSSLGKTLTKEEMGQQYLKDSIKPFDQRKNLSRGTNYYETQTPNGFDIATDLDKIVVSNPQTRKEIAAALRKAGINTKVTGDRAAAIERRLKTLVPAPGKTAKSAAALKILADAKKAEKQVAKSVKQASNLASSQAKSMPENKSIFNDYVGTLRNGEDINRISSFDDALRATQTMPAQNTLGDWVRLYQALKNNSQRYGQVGTAAAESIGVLKPGYTGLSDTQRLQAMLQRIQESRYGKTLPDVEG